MRSILTVIPARGGSKGVPRKNIATVGGKPLIGYAIESARTSKMLRRVIVSTDDEEIASVARSLGAEVPFLRPSELSLGSVTLIYVMRHALNFFDAQGERYDAVLSLQPTCPFIRPETLDRVVDNFHRKNRQAVATVARMSNGHPYTAKRLLGPDMDELEDFVTVPTGAVLFPRQKREEAYYFNGAVYLRDRALIESYEGHSYGLGENPGAVVVDSLEAVDINEPLDLDYAEAVHSRRFK
jgi:CMP-N-acetylneuraminic acid synthetase